ncbi:hypothetical protein ABH922_002766 [Rhodococcus sp. 27YEA15]|uniref:hypothetical protein n=1 Tax=Rhodococcus sp. 27YEA15 TaxID=3156259 RepID=UPI003C7B1AAF
MSNDIEHYAPTAVIGSTPIVQQNPAVSQLMQHAEAMSAAFDLAEKLCNTQLVPTLYRGKANDATAAILYGAELGLNPIQSLQQIFVVHGMPSIYARTMVGLMKSKGHKVWTEESTDESVTVSAQRHNESHIETSTWTMERAERAGYVPTIDEKTGKHATNANGRLIGNEKYLKDPQAMLYAKAASEVCRKIAPDILLGIAYTREELELEEAANPTRVKSERVPAPKGGTAGLAAKLGVTVDAGARTGTRTSAARAARTRHGHRDQGPGRWTDRGWHLGQGSGDRIPACPHRP